MVYSLDALFGLPRKKAAGSSSLFFCNQTTVDEFVVNSQSYKLLTKVMVVLCLIINFNYTIIIRNVVIF